MNQDVTSRFLALLETQREGVVSTWRSLAAASLRGRQTEAELARHIDDILGSLKGAAAGGALDLGQADAAELRALLADLSQSRARQGFSATETATTIFVMKEAILANIDASDTARLADFVEFSKFIDQMGLFTFESYAKAREELISDQAEQLLELSTPVVKLWEGVVAVPLVGTLDSARAQVVMERLLQALVDTGSPYAIIDITGVSAVDTQVAQHILKTVVAARLMGADCIISGIRPQIAQTIVALGIEFSDIVTKSTLADALTHALRASGMDIIRRAQRQAA